MATTHENKSNRQRSERLYKSGTGWCVWRWTYVPSDYITRLHLIKTPWFAVCLHWLNKPDQEPYLHDHPVSFLSIILRGWYIEYRQSEGEQFAPLACRKWYNFISASLGDRHRIMAVGPGTVTLCFMGPKVREWGFHVGNDWVYWKDYNKENYGEGTDLHLGSDAP